MIDTDYGIEALEYLLNKDCLAERYHPLILFKKELIERSRKLGYRTKNDIAKLSDSDFTAFGIHDEITINLLRRFLKIYDPDPKKFREIDKMNLNAEDRLAFNELYYLPGVKSTRASLYYHSGYKSLKDIANAEQNEILEKTAFAISEHKLSCIVPLPKEVHTHIAVAKAFTQGKKYAEFLYIAKLLNGQSACPLLYGSLGLEKRLSVDLDADDIDILLPENFLTTDWQKLIILMDTAGYRLIDEKEHKFVNGDITVAYAVLESLSSFAGIEIPDIPTVEDDGAKYRLLELVDYLKVYEASSKDGYRKNVKNKQDNIKISLIKKALESK